LDVQSDDLSINWGEGVGGTGAMQTYTQWDAQKTQACVCDPYYTGTDCSQKQCPRGDNVLTLVASTSSTQSFTVTGDSASTAAPSGTITITYMDLYGGVWTTRPITIPSGLTAADTVGAGNIANALIALPNAVIPAVTVTASSANAKTQTYTITFTDEANAGLQNLITVNWKGCNRAGCSPLYGGLVDAVAGKVITVSAVTQGVTSTTSLKENLVCAEHGICDSTTGQCKCFSGFYDLDCNQQTVLL